MNCSLFDLPCHATAAAQGAWWQVQVAIYEWWYEFSLLYKILILVGLWFTILYLTRGIIFLLHKLGGWKAVAPYVLAVGGFVVWLFLKFQPKKPEGYQTDIDGPDARGGPFHVPPPKRKRNLPRRFNPDTALWEEIK